MYFFVREERPSADPVKSTAGELYRSEGDTSQNNAWYFTFFFKHLLLNLNKILK